jgi:short-subunit dehydrogenase
MKNLKDKKIIITGANGGLGSEVAHLLASEGADLILLSQSEAGLQNLCQKIKSQNFKADYIKTDFSSIEGIKDAANIISEIDDIYMIIHLAGVMSFNSLGLESQKNIERLYNINLMAPIMLNKAVLPEMVKNKSGHIVNIGSIFGSIAFPYFSIYSSSKAALRGFSESLSRELDGTGVKVSYIAPRAVRTAINEGKNSEFIKRTNANLDDPKKIAVQILRAIKKEKKCQYLGFPESLFVRINYLFPSFVSKNLKKQALVAKDILTHN